MERNEIHGRRPDAGATVDLAPLLGDWRNSNDKTEWIKSFRLSHEHGESLIHIQAAVAPYDWGRTPVTFYLDNIGEVAFFAELDFPDMQARLAGNMNKGLWVIAAFYNFKDDKQPNFLCREFYYLDDEDS